MTEQRHVKLFRNGRNQAVRIPVEFELPGDEAIMHRDGERLVIEPVRKRGLIALLKTMKPIEGKHPRDRRSRADAGGRPLTRYMLDTNIISDLIRNPQGKAAKRIAKVGEDNICTSIIVAAELRYGCAKSGSERLLKAVEDLLAEIDVLPLDVPADAEYGGIRAELEAAGKPIGGNDLLIAAHAYATGATIVTANANEFKRIRGLKVENWLA